MGALPHLNLFTFQRHHLHTPSSWRLRLQQLEEHKHSDHGRNLIFSSHYLFVFILISLHHPPASSTLLHSCPFPSSQQWSKAYSIPGTIQSDGDTEMKSIRHQLWRHSFPSEGDRKVHKWLQFSVSNARIELCLRCYVNTKKGVTKFPIQRKWIIQ